MNKVHEIKKALQTQTTDQYIDALRVKFGVESDFAAMSRLGVNHRQQVCEWRKLRGSFSDELCGKVAESLNLDHAYVMACMRVQREKNEKLKAIWLRIANLTAGLAAVLVLAVSLSLGIIPTDQMQYGLIALSTGFLGGGGLYIMSNCLFTYWPLWLVLCVSLAMAFPYHSSPKKEPQK